MHTPSRFSRAPSIRYNQVHSLYLISSLLPHLTLFTSPSSQLHLLSPAHSLPLPLSLALRISTRRGPQQPYHSSHSYLPEPRVLLLNSINQLYCLRHKHQSNETHRVLHLGGLSTGEKSAQGRLMLEKEVGESDERI
jgi:hypothetical protein